MSGQIISGNKTKHTCSHFFFITDTISKEELEVEYCLTEKMRCDILNNPNQGSPSRLDRIHLINFPADYLDRAEWSYNYPKLLDIKQVDVI